MPIQGVKGIKGPDPIPVICLGYSVIGSFSMRHYEMLSKSSIINIIMQRKKNINVLAIIKASVVRLWDFHNRSSKIIGQVISINHRL